MPDTLDTQTLEFLSISPVRSGNSEENLFAAASLYMEEEAKLGGAQLEEVKITDNTKRRKSITYDELVNYISMVSIEYDKKLFTILAARTTAQRFNDMTHALLYLANYIKTLVSLSNDGDGFRELLKKYQTAIERMLTEGSQNGDFTGIANRMMPYITELTWRLIFKTKNPDHVENISRGQAIAITISRNYRTTSLGGLVLAIFGIGTFMSCGSFVGVSFGSSDFFALTIAKFGLEASGIGCAYAFYEVIKAFLQKNYKLGLALLAAGALVASASAGFSELFHTSSAALALDIASVLISTAFESIPVPLAVSASSVAVFGSVLSLCKSGRLLWKGYHDKQNQDSVNETAKNVFQHEGTQMESESKQLCHKA